MIRYILKKSLEDKEAIRIIYMSDKGITQRDIIVYNMDDEKITAYCYLRKCRRTFRINNILSAGRSNKYKH